MAGFGERIGVGLAEALAKISDRMQWTDERRAEVEAFDAAQLEKRRWSLAMTRKAWGEEHSGIPGKHLKLLVAGAVDATELACSAPLAALEQGALLIGLLGVPRTGKSLGAAHALWQRRVALDERRLADELDRPIAAMAAGLYVTAFKFCRTPEWEQSDHPAHRAELLVLDDVGREPAAKRLDLEELLFARFDDDLPTIFTANATTATIGDLLDGRLVDRIREVGMLIEFDKVLAKGLQR